MSAETLTNFGSVFGGQASKPQLVVISERRHKDDSPGKIHESYQSEKGASGLRVSVEGVAECRRSLTTVNGHHILIEFRGSGQPRVYADKDPQKLLSIIDN